MFVGAVIERSREQFFAINAACNVTNVTREHLKCLACHTLEMLPRYVRYATRGVDRKQLLSRALNHCEVEELRSQLLGRVAWYRCRIRLRARSLSLYWYALPYRPSDPGHARDLQAWNHMIEE